MLCTTFNSCVRRNRKRVINFWKSVLDRPGNTLVRKAMNEQMALGVKSEYFRYLLHWRKTSGVSGALSKAAPVIHSKVVSEIKLMIRSKSTAAALTLPKVGNNHKWYSPRPWVDDSVAIKTFAEFRLMNAGLGNRKPLGDGVTYKTCPLCAAKGILSANNEIHLAIECTSLNIFRNSCAIGKVIDLYKAVCPQYTPMDIYKLLLDDGNAQRVLNRAHDLYYMKRGWARLMGLE